jgi:hypothetical protein
MIAGRKLVTVLNKKCPAQFIASKIQKTGRSKAVRMSFGRNFASSVLWASLLRRMAISFSAALKPNFNFSGVAGSRNITTKPKKMGMMPSTKKIQRHASQPLTWFRSFAMPYDIRPLNAPARAEVA